MEDAKNSVNVRCKNVIVGGDYSGQEPRLTAFYSNDPRMIEAYKQKRDLYSVIASQSFNYPYEECLEFYPEGTEIVFEGNKVTCGYKTHKNKEGAHRRTLAKSILLGILYGRGAKSVGEQIGKSTEEAQEIIDKFFNAFPSVKKWIDSTMEMAHTKGYVEDIVGRRRRLPDILLPKFTLKDLSEKTNISENPLLYCKGLVGKTVNPKIDMYRKQLLEAKSLKQINVIKENAIKDKIDIKNNGGFISQAERQCVNARVQGGAATLTKLALIKIYNDERLHNIKAKLINTVHDEILIEVPEKFSEKASEYLIDDMVTSAKNIIPTVPMSVDTYCVTNWYLDEFSVIVEDNFKNLMETNNNDFNKSFEQIKTMYEELSEEQLKTILKNYTVTS